MGPDSIFLISCHYYAFLRRDFLQLLQLGGREFQKLFSTFVLDPKLWSNIFHIQHDSDYSLTKNGATNAVLKLLMFIHYLILNHFYNDRPRLGPPSRFDSPPKKQKMTSSHAALYGHRRADELYDLKTDPYEAVNLASNPSYSEQLKAMQNQLSKWIAETDDKGQYP